MTSNDLDFDVDLFTDDVADLPAWLAEVRETHPAAWVKLQGRRALLLSSYEYVSDAFRDEERFPGGAHYNQPGYVSVLGRTIQTYDGAEHKVQRSLVAPFFRGAQFRKLVESMLAPVAHQMLDEMEAKGGDGPFDLVAELTRPYPIKVIAAMLGLPLTDADTLARWAVALLDHGQNMTGARAAAEEFFQYLKPVIDQRRTDPGEDLLSQLATEEVDGERLTDNEIVAFISLLFPAGADTTYLNLGSTLWALLTNRDQWEKVAADPAGLADKAAAEGLRWYPATSLLPRTCPEDTEWKGIHIPAGTPMLLALLGAGRDPEVYPDPDTFDIERPVKATMTFGAGPHFCLGLHLARAEVSTVLRVLAERYPNLRLDPSVPSKIGSSFVTVLRGPDKLPVYLR
ncbi:cytochrome P450 [Enemella sp. A6]|uniref:cytochrome P450 n=1 Tax=Enemella sp. A6 TaxID=3440152 RepID=UPI003EBB81E3